MQQSKANSPTILSRSNVSEWSNASLNLQETHARLHRKWAEPYLARYYKQYLWNFNNIDPEEYKYYHYNGNWKDLSIGKRYLVSVLLRNESTRALPALGANIFIFEGYHRHTDDIVAQKKVKIQLRMQTASNYFDYWEEQKIEFNDDVDQEETKLTWIENLRIHSDMENYTLRFKCISTGKQYSLDPCGDEDVSFQVTSMHSVGWTHVEEHYIYTHRFPGYIFTDDLKAQEKMDHLEALNAQFLRSNVAAMRIQRHWRKATASPQYYLCRKRLCEEFETEKI